MNCKERKCTSEHVSYESHAHIHVRGFLADIFAPLVFEKTSSFFSLSFLIPTTFRGYSVSYLNNLRRGPRRRRRPHGDPCFLNLRESRARGGIASPLRDLDSASWRFFSWRDRTDNLSAATGSTSTAPAPNPDIKHDLYPPTLTTTSFELHLLKKNPQWFENNLFDYCRERYCEVKIANWSLEGNWGAVSWMRWREMKWFTITDGGRPSVIGIEKRDLYSTFLSIGRDEQGEMIRENREQLCDISFARWQWTSTNSKTHNPLTILASSDNESSPKIKNYNPRIPFW